MTVMEDTRGEIKDITSFKQTKELKPTLLHSHILNIDINMHILKIVCLNICQKLVV
jgi:hypothetical protein